MPCYVSEKSEFMNNIILLGSVCCNVDPLVSFFCAGGAESSSMDSFVFALLMQYHVFGQSDVTWSINLPVVN